MGGHQIYTKSFWQLMKLREGATPGLDLELWALGGTAAKPDTAMIVTETVVLAFSAGGIPVLHPHHLCLNLHIKRLSLKNYFIED